ncbi:MAG: hypothetical protein ACW7DS_18470 [Paraglaciecola chathamensis]
MQLMEIRDWILISSAIIVVAGWFVNSHLSRRHEMAKKRTEHRLEALRSFLPVWFSLQNSEKPFEEDKELVQKLATARSNFHLYGYKDEIETIEKFIAAVESGNVSEANETLKDLVPLVRNRVRRELGISA